jgi:dephospho-CoA kinase
MLRVGLTGGIATGKSYVLEQFRRRGYPCLDADELAHGEMAAGTEASRAIAHRFGQEVLGSDGAVDRPRLGPIVFADPQARRDLEALVHPAVYRAIEAAVRGFERIGAGPLVLVDVPLRSETGHADDFDSVIVTASPPAVQVERLVKRGLTEADARRRLEAQLPTSEKTARADFVIQTGGSYEDTDRQIEEIVSQLNRPRASV